MAATATVPEHLSLPVRPAIVLLDLILTDGSLITTNIRTLVAAGHRVIVFSAAGSSRTTNRNERRVAREVPQRQVFWRFRVLEPAILSMVAALAGKALAAAAPPDKLVELVRARFAEDPEKEALLEEAEAHPDDPEVQSRFKQELIDVLIVDADFAGLYTELAMADDMDQTGEVETADEVSPVGPVRGFPGLTVVAASPQTTAGSDFSIFVLVQNPFDVPITVHQVQTHIPVELIDVNQLSVRGAKLLAELASDSSSNGLKRLWKRFWGKRQLRRDHLGVATAVGTEFAPDLARDIFRSNVAISRDLTIHNSTASFSAVNVVLPKGATSGQLDAVMRRMVDYQRGVLPVTLQPGDSVVRQFVLRTRSRLLFRPLSHTFQIQANYAVDGVDHTGTIPFQLSIQAAIGSISWGSAVGSLLGTVVKTLGSPADKITLWGATSAFAVSVIAGVAVVIAFARKNSAQPLVSIEDFWGGLAIGFSVGYFGFDKFANVLPAGQ